jgi:hypothetical protein
VLLKDLQTSGVSEVRRRINLPLEQNCSQVVSKTFRFTITVSNSYGTIKEGEWSCYAQVDQNLIGALPGQRWSQSKEYEYMTKPAQLALDVTDLCLVVSTRPNASRERACARRIMRRQDAQAGH